MQKYYIFYVVFIKKFIFINHIQETANSEKYLICKVLYNEHIYRYIKIINKWESLEKSNYYVNDIFSDTIPSCFLRKIKEFNKKNSEAQIHNIKKTIELIDKKKSISFLNNIIQSQIKKAIEWCNKYNESINYKSELL